MAAPFQNDAGESDWLMALAEPSRLAILRALAAKSMTGGELVAASGISASNIWRHTRILERAGFITSEREHKGRRFGLLGVVANGGITFTHAGGAVVCIPLV